MFDGLEGVRERMARRSIMFTPGDRPEMMRKAPDAGADVVVFDVEDAVSPARKDEARDTVRSVLVDPDFDPDAEVCVRVNAAPAGWQADLDALFDGESEIRLDAVMCPKVESPDDLRAVADTLDAYDKRVPLFALIESARGVLRADELAAVSAVEALVFGSEDLAADVGATTTPSLAELDYARQRVVLAAAAHDVSAIDTMVTDFSDEDQLVESTETAVQYGYDGKLAIHPAQVDAINEAFTPDRDELEWATAVMAAKAEADAAGRGVFEVDGEMIDAPLVAKAERIVRRADAAGLDF